ncbi:probable Probable transporter SEO1 [Saccharomycodes ludwigii]|uniref:Probable Probable transporter SEO1 n=1 Tax=Saccharomycodes ludwigii TaxID=36035 RepID=A0A376B1A4_9ASCO|nr:hypothetical protein SCDLUD_001165 [Saccharomycodes ludwigii]KAH3903524.1 hypothetical protein SCDLUD_001165 [Saccharomycodes ludwigii]SSD58465.1 probable Probable transporter SEO1 [Saccharomycodes ludwigii]
MSVTNNPNLENIEKNSDSFFYRHAVVPYRRLKWGFLPVRREVEDYNDKEKKDLLNEDTFVDSISSSNDNSQKILNVETVGEEEKENKESYNVETKNNDIEQFTEINSPKFGTHEQQITNYEYRDEANRKWWSFFNEEEYRVSNNKKKQVKWYQWFGPDVSTAEKKLILKLDILLSFYSLLAYWVKYLDTTNLNNAYVSGMQQELNFKGNDLVHVQVMYTIGNIIFQLPFLFYLNKIPLNYLLPVLDLCWSLLTIGAAYVNSVNHLKAIRFFIGAFEAPSYLAYQYLFGCFYKHDEMARRSSFYYLGQYLGILSSSGIQSGVYQSLNGKNGLSGWRWNFIIDAIISVVVGFIGFYSLPGDPHNCYSIFLTDDEIRLARKRLKENHTEGADFKAKVFDVKVWKRILCDWKIYILSLWNIFCWNNNNGTSGAYLLWIKSLKKYSVSKINQLGMITPGLGMIYLFLTGVYADKMHSRWQAIIITQVFNFIGNVILAVWYVPEGAKWFAFMLQYFGWSMAPILYSFMNDICRRDSQSRSIVLVFMNIMAQTSTAWISVLVWKTAESPRYLKGFTWTAVAAFCLSAWTFVVLYFYKKDERKFAKENGIILYNSKTGENYPPPRIEEEEREEEEEEEENNHF